MNEFEVAKKAIEDFNSHKIGEYELVGHFKVIVKALEKQIPAKLINKAGRYAGHYLCPTCNKMYWKDEIVPNYCQGCGQKFYLD